MVVTSLSKDNTSFFKDKNNSLPKNFLSGVYWLFYLFIKNRW